MIGKSAYSFFRLIAAVILTMPFPAVGQMSYGIKAGINISDVVLNNMVDPDIESDYRAKFGMQGGLFVNTNFDDRTGLAIELLYSNKGVNVINNNHFHYIVIPFLARYNLDDNFVAEAGPELGYLVSARSKHGNINDIWDNNLDLGLDVGVQYDAHRWLIGLRFNAGITSVQRNQGISPGDRIRYQNRVLSFALAYKIRVIE